MVITDNGRNSIRNNWVGDTAVYPAKIQLGGGPTTPTESDTGLSGSPTSGNNENEIDSYNKDATGSATFVNTFGTGEANATHTEAVLTTDAETTSTLTSDPSDVANSVCTDTSLSLTTNEWANKRVRLTHAGTDYYYTVSSNTSNTFTIDDNAYTDGVRSGDAYIIDTVLAHSSLASFTKSTSFMMRSEWRVPFNNI